MTEGKTPMSNVYPKMQVSFSEVLPKWSGPLEKDRIYGAKEGGLGGGIKGSRVRLKMIETQKGLPYQGPRSFQPIM